jgi:hypothetical protein
MGGAGLCEQSFRAKRAGAAARSLSDSEGGHKPMRGFPGLLSRVVTGAGTGEDPEVQAARQRGQEGST